MNEPQKFDEQITDEDSETFRQLLLNKPVFTDLLIESGCNPKEAEAEITKAEYLVGIWDLKHETESKISFMREKVEAKLARNGAAIEEIGHTSKILSRRLDKIESTVKSTQALFTSLAGSELGSLEKAVVELEGHLYDRDRLVNELSEQLNNQSQKNNFLEAEISRLKRALESERQRNQVFEEIVQNLPDVNPAKRLFIEILMKHDSSENTQNKRQNSSASINYNPRIFKADTALNNTKKESTTELDLLIQSQVAKNKKSSENPIFGDTRSNSSSKK